MTENKKKKKKSRIERLLAGRNIIFNKTKAVFSLITIFMATTLTMGLAVFQSCYKTEIIRTAEGYPQVTFCDITREQVDHIKIDEEVESVSATEKNGMYDLNVAVVDARKMTRYGFTVAVENIAGRNGIDGTHIHKGEVFMSTLPDGGLINSENMFVLFVGFLVVVVSSLVIYNVFYLAIVSQINEFGQLKTIGMSEKQIMRMNKKECRILCLISIPVGLITGGVIGRSFHPAGWDIGKAIWIGIIVSLIIYCAVGISVRKPAKFAAKVSPINALKYTGDESSAGIGKTVGLKRNLSPLGISIIGIKANWKRFLLTVVSLGVSGMLFTLVAVYIASFDADTVVDLGVHKYGQLWIKTTMSNPAGYESEMELAQDIKEIQGVDSVKVSREIEATWACGNKGVEDGTMIVNGSDYSDISDEIIAGEHDYQTLINNDQIIMVDGLDGIELGDDVIMRLDGNTKRSYQVGAVLKEDTYSDTAIYGGWFMVPEELLDEKARENLTVTDIIVSVEDSKKESVEERVREYVDSVTGVVLSTREDAIAQKEDSFKQVSMALIGVAVFLLTFSIINYISTIIMNIATKKQEFAVLQSIGMNKKDVEYMQVGEGTMIVAGSSLVTFGIGNIIGMALITALRNSGMVYLKYSFPIGMFVFYMIILLLIAKGVTVCVFRILQRHSIVEQLRKSAI